MKKIKLSNVRSIKNFIKKAASNTDESFIKLGTLKLYLLVKKLLILSLL